MKINYIPKGSPDCPLIEISQTTDEEIHTLLTIWASLAAREGIEFDLANTPSNDNNDLIHLVCKSGKKDIGIIQTANHHFECILGCETWLQVHGLTEPFLKEKIGFQWLVDVGQISLLLSPHGGW